MKLYNLFGNDKYNLLIGSQMYNEVYESEVTELCLRDVILEYNKLKEQVKYIHTNTTKDVNNKQTNG